MSDALDLAGEDELRALVFQLAEALWPHHDDWWEDAPEAVNHRHRVEVLRALDAARSIGWSPWVGGSKP